MTFPACFVPCPEARRPEARRRLVLLAGIALLLPAAAQSARAGDCTPYDLSQVPVCIPMAPDGGLTYAVRIVGCGGPIQNSHVNLLFNTVGDSLVCWCNSSPWNPAAPHSFFANTDAQGVARFNLAAGGCVENQLAAIPGNMNYAAEVFADFVKMGECGVVSPDVVDNNGRKATDSLVWNPAGSCATGLADAVAHTTPLATAAYSWCSDINCDHAVTLGDGVMLTPFLANAVTCAGNAGY